MSAGFFLVLEGPEGAGKTTFVKALVRGLGSLVEATSPSYSLVHRYPGPRGPIYHVDCYRLRTPEQAADLDWEGLHRANALLIEWPERAGPWALPPTRKIRLEHGADPDRRWLEVSG